MNKHTMEELKYKQALPLEIKVKMTKQRIREWVKEYGTDGVYVSFSGGKDSTVLLHIVREMYPNVPAVFCDTGLEYPEIREFVRTFDNVTWLKPKMNFRQVIETYGYPFFSKEISQIVGGGQRSLRMLKEDGIDINDREAVIAECAKRFRNSPGEWRRLAQCYGAITRDGQIKPNVVSEEKGRYSDIPHKYKCVIDAPFRVSANCCNEMKKKPFHEYGKETGRKPFTAQMAVESQLRTTQWIRHGCNVFGANAISNPMSFWTEQDVLRYIKENNIPIASIYGDIVYAGEDGTEYESTLFAECSKMKTTRMARTGCMFCGYGCHMEKGKGRFELMKETHPKQYEYIMKPWDKGGLDYKGVIDWVNEHCKTNIKY